jgi:flavin-dependent dehydrogenase
MGPSTKDGPMRTRGHRDRRRADTQFRLEDGARVAVIGGGPAGSLFTYFLLRFAAREAFQVHVDIYEPRDFTSTGPRGCNMCGGLVAGPLVESLRAEGITLPQAVVKNRIDSYSLVTSAGSVRVVAPGRRPPALAVYRGAGPRDTEHPGACGLDGFLLELVQRIGANVVRSRVTTVAWAGGRPEISTGGTPIRYDLLAVATGVNLAGGRLLDDLGMSSTRPETSQVYVTELRSEVARQPDTTMEIVVPDVAGVDAVGVIPKGEFSTLCVLGKGVDRPAVEAVFGSPLMQQYAETVVVPTGGICHCAPRLNVREAPQPFANRVVLVGDCGVARLYKDGLGSAFRTARAAARTAVCSGVGEGDFRRGYWPVYHGIARDNRYGMVVFALLRKLRRTPRLLRASLSVAESEQDSGRSSRPMNGILWDLFTGGHSYRSILRRVCDPRLALRVGARLVRSTAGSGGLSGHLPESLARAPEETGGCPGAMATPLVFRDQ